MSLNSNFKAAVIFLFVYLFVFAVPGMEHRAELVFYHGVFKVKKARRYKKILLSKSNKLIFL